MVALWTSNQQQWRSVLQDLRYALRSLSRNPGLVAAAVICLALGIGANATIFGVVDTLLFRAPPHVQDSDRIVRLYFRRTYRSFGTATSGTTGYPIYTTMRDLKGAWDGVAAYSHVQKASVGRGGDARRATLVLASASYFPLLGVRPALGRFYGEDEDRLGGPSVAVLSHEFWRSAFGGDSGVVGRALPLGRGSYTIVGVAPRGFTGVNLQSVDVWAPLTTSTAELLGPYYLNAGSHFLQVIGRLGPVARADAERRATAAFRAQPHYGEDDSTAVALLGPIQQARGPERSDNAKISLWLTAVSLIVLLVACANVANLLLAHALTRQREIAVRLALGSGWWRLTRQVIVESIVLALFGGIAALLVTLWGGPLIRTYLLQDTAVASAPLDGRVVLFTGLIAILTGLLAGAIPAWELRRGDITPALKAGAGEGRYQRSRLRAGLLVGQIALTVVLVVGAGLFVRSLRNVEGQDFGIDLNHTLLVTTDLRAAGYSSAEINRAYSRMLESVQAFPGVEAAAATVGHPFGSHIACSASVPSRDSMPQLPTGGPYCQQVTPAYFAALGTPVRGRAFTAADRGAPVAVVNQTMARLLWPGEDAVGKCFVRSDKRCYEVVGVVPNPRRFSAVEDVSMIFYEPFAGDSSEFITALVLRAKGRPDDLIAPVRNVVQATVANLPYVNITPISNLVAPSIRPWQLGSTMFGAFALLALVLSAVGLYGVLAYTVAQRTHEMGVRVAMGAQRWDVLRLMILHGVGITALGAGLGALVALAAGQVLSSLMYGVSPRDPLVLFAAALLPIVVSGVASYVPAVRASRVDPVVALRYE
jgi:predicted permease